ncbi:MAG: hypothetical protein QW463_04040, partial [Candidatus Caldarchaeum sp.]
MTPPLLQDNGSNHNGGWGRNNSHLSTPSFAGSPTTREVAEKHYREEVFQTPEQLLQNIKRIYPATTPNT